MSRESISGWAQKISSLFLLLAVGFLFWRRNHILNYGVSIPAFKPSDIFIVLSVLTLIVSLILRQDQETKARWKSIFPWVKNFFLLFLFFTLGSLLSGIYFNRPLSWLDFAQYLRVGLGVGAFFLILFLGFKRESYVKLLIFSFLSALVITPFIFLSEETIIRWFLVVSPVSYNFIGFQPGAAVLANLLVGSAMLLFALTCSRGKLNFWQRYLSLLGFILIVALILWAGSRAVILGTLLGSLVILGVKVWRAKLKLFFVWGLAAISLSFLGGFFILPGLAKNTLLVKLFPRLNLETHVSHAVLEKVSAGKNFEKKYFDLFLPLPKTFFISKSKLSISAAFYQSRGEIWVKHIRNFIAHPFGVGLSYASIFGEKNSIGQPVEAHNTWLQVAESGGIGALLVFGSIVFLAMKALLNLIKREADLVNLFLLGSFVGLITTSLFFDMLTFRWFWIILGLIIVTYHNRLPLVPKTSLPPPS